MASSSSGKKSLEELESALYARCAQTDSLLNQNELLEFGVIPDNSTDKLMQCVQNLLRKNLLRAHGSGENTSFKAVKKEIAAKYQALSPDEAMIFSHIEQSGREGIWTRTLKLRTNIHQSIVTRCIKSLESRGFIKPTRSVKSPGQTLYMLTSLTPSEEVTGGPWFTDGELDTAWVELLCNALEKYISSKSFHTSPHTLGRSDSSSQQQPAKKRKVADVKAAKQPQLPERERKRTRQLLPFPPGYQRYPTLKEIKSWINASGITDVSLTDAHVERLVDVLYFDGRIEKVLDGTAYKAVWKPPASASISNVKAEPGIKRPRADETAGLGTALTNAPCGVCPVFHLCEEGGPVSASNCEYFTEWLVF